MGCPATIPTIGRPQVRPPGNDRAGKPDEQIGTTLPTSARNGPSWRYGSVGSLSVRAI